MNKYLIINADDFGANKSVNEAIISLLASNKISSATLMPNSKASKHALGLAKNNSKNIGLHLTFVNDDCKFKCKSITGAESLINSEGYLLEDKITFIKKCTLKDLKAEIEAQFDSLLDMGIEISHVDSHRYSVYPTYRPIAFLLLCKECNKRGKIPMRWTRNGYYDVGNGIGMLCDSDNAAKFFAAIADLYKINIPDYVFKFPYRNTFSTYEEKKKALINMIHKLPDGISEIHIHPAIDNEEIREINPTFNERILEYNLIYDKDLEAAIKESKVQLITYRDINALKKNSSRIQAGYNIVYYAIKYVMKKLIAKV